MDDGAERITDDDVLQAVRAQARRVQLQSVTAAALLTAAFFAVP